MIRSRVEIPALLSSIRTKGEDIAEAWHTGSLVDGRHTVVEMLEQIIDEARDAVDTIRAGGNAPFSPEPFTVTEAEKESVQ